MAASTGAHMRTLLSVVVAVTAALMLPQDSSKSTSLVANLAPTVVVRGPVPFGVGEKTEYRARYGALNVGTGAMEVKGIGSLRGRPTWNVELRVSAKVPVLYSVTGTFSSWMDTSSLYSLQYVSDQVENRNKRLRFFEIYPEKSTYRQRITPDTLREVPSVPDPLDETSFLFFIRTIPLVVGETYTFPRYFRPDRNPVVIRVIGKDTVSVPAGSFPAIVIQPTIKTPSGLFAQDAETRVWISDDPSKMILKVVSKTALFALQLDMTNYTPAKLPPGR